MGAAIGGFVFGLFIGGSLGFTAAAVVVVGREESRRSGDGDE